MKKVHSLIDKVYQPTNLRMAWEKVRSNKGAGGIDKETISSFEVKMEEELQKLHEELKMAEYKTLPVKRVHIKSKVKLGKSGH